MLQKLNEYRDVITVIVFFLGGFFWLQKNYASKDELSNKLVTTNEKITRLNCLLEANIEGVTAQLELKILPVNIEQIQFKIKELSKNTDKLTNVEQNLLQDFRRQLASNQDELSKVVITSNGLLKRSNQCAGVSS